MQPTIVVAVRGVSHDDQVGKVIYAVLVQRILEEAVEGRALDTVAYANKMVLCGPAAVIRKAFKGLGISLQRSVDYSIERPDGWVTRDMHMLLC